MVKVLVYAMGYGFRWFAVRPENVSPVAEIGKLSQPLLILHGEKDRIVPAAHARALHSAAGETSRMRILPGSGHSRIHPRLRASAERRVVTFFLNALAPPTALNS